MRDILVSIMNLQEPTLSLIFITILILNWIFVYKIKMCLYCTRNIYFISFLYYRSRKPQVFKIHVSAILNPPFFLQHNMIQNARYRLQNLHFFKRSKKTPSIREGKLLEEKLLYQIFPISTQVAIVLILKKKRCYKIALLNSIQMINKLKWYYP